MKVVKYHWLNLSATNTREDLVVDAEKVATRERVKGWDCVKEFVDKVPRESDIDIGLLIGINCAKALEPQ